FQFVQRQMTPGIWIHTTGYYGSVLKDLRGDSSALDDLQAATRSIIETKFRLRIGYWLGTLADMLARQGRNGAASGVIEEAIQHQIQQNERWCRPELLRIKASILRRTGQLSAMESTLHDALEEAHAIGALSFEIKVANDLAAHYLDLNRRNHAVQLL